MSFDTKRDEITVNDVVYDVERTTDHTDGSETLTIELDGEQVFEGLEGRLGYENDGWDGNNPRTWSNVGTMFCDYRGYTLGDEDAPDPRDQSIECSHCEGSGDDQQRWLLERWDEENRYTLVGAGSYESMNAEYEMLKARGESIFISRDNCPVCKGECMIEVDPIEYLRREHGARVIMPLYVYEHSGITIRAGKPIGPKLTRDDVRSTGRFVMDDAGWDTSTVGFVFDTPQGVKDCIGEDATDEQIEKALDSEVQVYASYLEGDVTFWRVEDEETGFDEGCGGYVGDSDYCESECFTSLEEAIVKRLAEMTERAAMAARDIETI